MHTYSYCLLIPLVMLLNSSCHTYYFPNGKKVRQFMPAKDRIKSDYIDTVSYYRQNFNYSNYTQQIGIINKKRLVETLEGDDLKILANTGN